MSKKDKKFDVRNGLLYRVIHNNVNRGMASRMSAPAFERELIELLNKCLEVINEGLVRDLSPQQKL
jgi:hypothetical protein